MDYLEKIEDLAKFIDDEWNRLDVKYELNDVTFEICGDTYFAYRMAHELELVEDISFNNFDDMMAEIERESQYNILCRMYPQCTFDGEILIHMSYRVLMSRGSIVNEAMNRGFQMHELKKLYQTVLLHEVGHILHYRKICVIGETTEEAIDRLEHLHRCGYLRFEKWKKDNPDRSKEKHAKRYYSIKSEREANKLVGLTWKDFM